MEYKQALALCFKKLGRKKIMAIATSVNDHVTIRNISAIIYDDRIFFKTDKNFPKTQQLLINPNVAICYWGVQIEGQAVNHGLVREQSDTTFQEMYDKYWKRSYTAYAHEEAEILIEILPRKIEIWDQDKEDRGFQVIIDCEAQTVEIQGYD
ncbi:pyridoxamine 5'-phosphate oxidase family protein [Enterococcus olivae]